MSGGFWVPAGTLLLNGANVLEAQLSSFQDPWNADDPLNTTCIVVTADCSCTGASTSGFSVQGQGVSYAQSFTAVKDQCVNVKTSSALELTPIHNDMDPVPVEITTPSTLTKCTTTAQCRTVTFHCPKDLPLTAALSSCTGDPDWYCADGFANEDDPAFDTVWTSSEMQFASGAMTLGLEPCVLSDCKGMAYQGAQYQSTCYYGYGRYEAKFQAAAGSGVVTSFFVFTGPGDGPRQDEIDIEVFGRPGTDKGCAVGQSAAQVTYFVNAARYEQPVCLAFDATQSSRWYAFEWRATGITFYADQNGDGDLLDTGDQLAPPSTIAPLPTQPGKIMVNLWAGSSDPDTVTWMGAYSYDAGNPNVAIYDAIQYTP